MSIAITTLLTNKRAQVVRMPTEARLPDDVKLVMVQIRGSDRIITPIKNTWDSFFFNGPVITDDFLDERGIKRPK
jgi:antitoxin VapB